MVITGSIKNRIDIGEVRSLFLQKLLDFSLIFHVINTRSDFLSHSSLNLAIHTSSGVCKVLYLLHVLVESRHSLFWFLDLSPAISQSFWRCHWLHLKNVEENMEKILKSVSMHACMDTLFQDLLHVLLHVFDLRHLSLTSKEGKNQRTSSRLARVVT